jgi:hypothetical protein
VMMVRLYGKLLLKESLKAVSGSYEPSAKA